MSGAEVSAQDEGRITRLVARYADAVARADAGDLGATWSADGAWRIGETSVHGRGPIVERWSELRARYEHVIHLVQPGFVGCTPGGAVGRWLVTEILRRVSEQSDRLQVSCYTDHYVRSGDEWLFSERILTVHYRGHLPRGEFVPLPPLADV